METKTCSGKHGCGKELPIDNFYIVCTKSKGKVYSTRQSICKNCLKERTKQYRNTEKGRTKANECASNYYHSKKGNKKVKKYWKTERGKQVRRNACRTWREKNPEDGKERMKVYRENLLNNYVKTALEQISIPRINHTPELIDVKRAQLKLHRYANQENNQQIN